VEHESPRMDRETVELLPHKFVANLSKLKPTVEDAMSDTLTLPPPVERKCSIEEVFDAGFIELLKLVPANPYVRALVLKFTANCHRLNASCSTS